MLRGGCAYILEPIVANTAKKILIADDDADIRRMLRFHLEDRGFELVIARNGAEALEMILVENPDAVILDVMMPELTGWEVLKYLRTKDAFKELPVLMLTGIGESLNETTSPLFGASAFLDKPFDLDDVDAKLDEFFAS